MAGTNPSTARPAASAPLRRRLHLLERAARRKSLQHEDAYARPCYNLEVHSSLYHADHPHSARIPVTGPRTQRAARAAAALRTTELRLLAFNALITAIRPLRELAARIATRTPSSTPKPLPTPSASPSSSDVADVAAPPSGVKALVECDTYVENALALFERGMRRVERRVGKLKSAAKKASAPEAGGSKTGCYTIFVPASLLHPPRCRPSPAGSPPSHLLLWIPRRHRRRFPPSGAGANGKQRALDSIPEEPAVFFPPSPVLSTAKQHLGVVEVLPQFLAAGLAPRCTGFISCCCRCAGSCAWARSARRSA
ncbi:hypothetical protein C8R45DRAFT_1184354 [Mycena sanguinolenta]|nr:hypothetical protein C8R45DRAFT_1184354 [Mycena sanguinolenta]